MSVEIIAEIGQAHDGSLGIAYSYIDNLAGTGVDTIKWQVHIAAAESSPFEPFRVPFAVEDNSRFDYWQRTSFDAAQWQSIKQHCEKKGMRFLASPFSMAAIDLLEAIGAERYKIGSGEIANTLLLTKLAQIGKPVILSTGLAAGNDLENAIKIFSKKGIAPALLQCTTAYPTPPEQWYLQQILQLREKYSCVTGYSDHSGRMESAIAAVVLGAEIIEFHVVFDQGMFGPDAKASIEVRALPSLVASIRNIEKAMAHDKNTDTNTIDTLKSIFGKSLAVNRPMQAGEKINFTDLESKKPAGHGIPANAWEDVVGKRLVKTLSKWDFIEYDDIAHDS